MRYLGSLLCHHHLVAQDNIEIDSISANEQDRKAQSSLTSAH